MDERRALGEKGLRQSVVTWRRAQMVLLSVQGMDVTGIAKVTFTSADRVREVVNNFNDDGFDSLYPKYFTVCSGNDSAAARRVSGNPVRSPSRAAPIALRCCQFP
jgi:hypothetical protein